MQDQNVTIYNNNNNDMMCESVVYLLIYAFCRSNEYVE